MADLMLVQRNRTLMSVANINHSDLLSDIEREVELKRDSINGRVIGF